MAEKWNNRPAVTWALVVGLLANTAGVSYVAGQLSERVENNARVLALIGPDVRQVPAIWERLSSTIDELSRGRQDLARFRSELLIEMRELRAQMRRLQNRRASAEDPSDI